MNTFEEEISLWLKISTKDGRLFVRTEKQDVIEKIKTVLAVDWREIAFYPEATDISSFTADFYALKKTAVIYTFGLKLIML
jgi:hypothetical protein